jgi:hypothetical protein
MRGLLAFLAGIVGAIAGASGLGFSLAYILTEMYGPREGSAGMAGFFMGAPVGAIAGFALGLWLVLRRKEASPGAILAWLAGCVVALVVIGAFVWDA